MNIENSVLPQTAAPLATPVAPAAPVATPAPAAPRTNNQIKSTAMADGRAVKAKWKPLIAEAKIVWSKLYPEELAKVDGNFHVLAGLVQMRYQLSREESNRQVTAFLDKHYGTAASASPPK